jgi:hypothetical protein
VLDDLVEAGDTVKPATRRKAIGRRPKVPAAA